MLHFATHALLEDRHPLYSALVLSPSKPAQGEDGLLEAWEILGLRLDADLVVLSACQTARGRLPQGEGMVGLTWALAVRRQERYRHPFYWAAFVLVGDHT